MTIPPTVIFEDDFINPNLGPAWVLSASGGAVATTAQGHNAPSGFCLLYTNGGTQGAVRVHQGADGAVISPGGGSNDAPLMDCRTWMPSKNLKLEARVGFNVATQDAGFTVGFIGPRDPENVLCAEYSGSWYLQARRGNHEAPITQESTGFNHIPGQTLDICLEATATQATLSINGVVAATVTDVSAIPSEAMCFELQCWNNAPNHAQVSMWVDWVKITQDR